MIYSMTGYGKGNAVKHNLSVEVELRSVNSRFLELFLKLPPSMATREYEIREIIKAKVKRGKINVVIKLEKNIPENSAALINQDKLIDYINLLNKVKKLGKIKEDIKLEHILNSREIFSVSEIELTDSEFNLVKKAVQNALSNFMLMKKHEGNELAKDLSKRVKKIERKVISIEKEFNKGVKSYYRKLRERIQKILGDASIDKERLNLELALIADKSDVTEECVRLKSHLKFFTETMYKQAEPGKKLNFLCQELNREANTISSKSISTSITHKAVAIKEEVEKIREQIQNIE